MGCFVFLFFLVSPGCPSPGQDGVFFSFFSTLMFGVNGFIGWVLQDPLLVKNVKI